MSFVRAWKSTKMHRKGEHHEAGLSHREDVDAQQRAARRAERFGYLDSELVVAAMISPHGTW
jgi:hypothetical protein